MNTYIKSIIAVTVAVSLILSVMPKGAFSKYISLVAGLVVLTVVIRPVINVHIPEYEVSEFQAETDYVADEFSRRLEAAIVKELSKKGIEGVSVSVDATAEKIEEVRLFPYTQRAAEAVENFTGVKGVVRK